MVTNVATNNSGQGINDPLEKSEEERMDKQDDFPLYGWDDGKVYYWDEERKHEWCVSDDGVLYQRLVEPGQQRIL
jgi:hypothetical protein